MTSNFVVYNLLVQGLAWVGYGLCVGARDSNGSDATVYALYDFDSQFRFPGVREDGRQDIQTLSSPFRSELQHPSNECCFRPFLTALTTGPSTPFLAKENSSLFFAHQMRLTGWADPDGNLSFSFGRTKSDRTSTW